MAYKNGKDAQEGSETEKKVPENGQSGDENQVSKSALDFRNDRWKLTPTPADGNRLGDPLTFQTIVGTGGTAKKVVVRNFVPGIARVGFVPTFGVSRDAGSPISTLASTVYSDILAALKRSSLTFDPTAVIVHMLAFDSMYCAYDMAVRAYRALNTTDADNAYLAKNLVEACGFNYEDLLRNKPNLYFWFSTTKATLAQYVVPKRFKMIGAHRAMCTNAYHDSPSAKSQLYVFTPDYLWSWAKVDTAGGLKSVTLTEGNGDEHMTYDTFTTKFNAMLQALLNSTDFKNINAALRATYPEDDVYTFDMPQPDETLPLVIDEVVLNSLLNATTFGTMSQGAVDTFAPTDTFPNTFVIQPKVANTNKNYAHIINSINDCPTSEEMVSNMRWHVAFDVDRLEAGAAQVDVLSCGTEIITNIRASALNDDCPFMEIEIMGSPVKVTKFSFGGANIRPLSNTVDVNHSQDVTADFYPFLAQAFRWRPIIQVTRYHEYEGGIPSVWSMLATDWNYQAIVSTADLISWHTALLFSACDL